MRFEEFEAAAQQVWDSLPAEYKTGVDGLVVERDARSSGRTAGEDIYTMGECVTDSFPSSYDGPETTRSLVILYYGSFLRLSVQDPDFDWRHELEETITHELQHHLEALASEDALIDLDYAVDQNFRRLDGESFDPLFFRAGEQIGERTYCVEEDVFFEVPASELPANRTVALEWQGARHQLRIPALNADVTFLQIENPPAGRLAFCVVVVAARGPLRMIGDLLRRRPLTVGQTTASLEPVG